MVRFIRRDRVLIVVLAMLAYAIIQLNANIIVAQIYGYFTPRPLGVWDHIVAFVCTIVPALLLPNNSSPPATAAWVLYGLVYLSVGTICVAVMPSIQDYIAIISFFSMGLIVFTYTAHARIGLKLTHLPLLKHVDIFMIVSALFVAAIVWQESDFSLTLSVDNVYERRLEARETDQGLGYFTAPFRILIPILAIYAWLVRGNLWWGITAGIGCLAIFSYEGTKSIILYPMVLSLLALGIKLNRVPALLLGGIIVISMFSLIEYLAFDSIFLADYVIRRAFVVPGMLVSMYWDYLPNVTTLHSITYEVGFAYFDDNTANANTNFLIWGLAWSGWLGGAVIAMVAGLLVGVFNTCPGSRFPWMGSLMAGGCALIWSEQFLHTSMLSSGVVYVLAVAMIMRSVPQGFPSLTPDEERLRHSNRNNTTPSYTIT